MNEGDGNCFDYLFVVVLVAVVLLWYDRQVHRSGVMVLWHLELEWVIPDARSCGSYGVSTRMLSACLQL